MMKCKMCGAENPKDLSRVSEGDGATEIFHMVKSSVSGGGQRLCGPVEEKNEEGS